MVRTRLHLHLVDPARNKVIAVCRMVAGLEDAILAEKSDLIRKTIVQLRM